MLFCKIYLFSQLLLQFVTHLFILYIALKILNKSGQQRYANYIISDYYYISEIYKSIPTYKSQIRSKTHGNILIIIIMVFYIRILLSIYFTISILCGIIGIGICNLGSIFFSILGIRMLFYALFLDLMRKFFSRCRLCSILNMNSSIVLFSRFLRNCVLYVDSSRYKIYKSILFC